MSNMTRNRKNQLPTGEGKHQSPHQGEPRKLMKRSDVLERGNIYFVYRPKVEHASAAGLEDIQRFFVILSPFRLRPVRLDGATADRSAEHATA